MPRLYEEVVDDYDLYSSDVDATEMNGEEAHIHFVLRDLEELVQEYGAGYVLARLDEDTVADFWAAFNAGFSAD